MKNIKVYNFIFSKKSTNYKHLLIEVLNNRTKKKKERKKEKKRKKKNK